MLTITVHTRTRHVDYEVRYRLGQVTTGVRGSVRVPEKIALLDAQRVGCVINGVAHSVRRDSGAQPLPNAEAGRLYNWLDWLEEALSKNTQWHFSCAYPHDRIPWRSEC